MAITERCAESSYATTTIGEVATTAAVSRKAFYECFESKEACLFAAHEEISASFFEAIDSACRGQGRWPDKVSAALRRALSFFAADPAAAQLLSYGVLSAGSPGVERYHAMVASLASRLRAAPTNPGAARTPQAELAAIVFTGATVGKTAIEGDASAILALESELLPMLLGSPASP